MSCFSTQQEREEEREEEKKDIWLSDICSQRAAECNALPKAGRPELLKLLVVSAEEIERDRLAGMFKKLVVGPKTAAVQKCAATRRRLLKGVVSSHGFFSREEASE